MSQIVRITINKKLATVLEVLRNKFPALDDSEIFKLTLSDYFSNKVLINSEDASYIATAKTKKSTVPKKAVNLVKLTKKIQFQRQGDFPAGQTWKDVYYSDVTKKYIKNRYKIKVQINQIIREIVLSAMSQIRFQELIIEDTGNIKVQMNKYLGLTENFFEVKNFVQKKIFIEKDLHTSVATLKY
jgi:hypothetical protein